MKINIIKKVEVSETIDIDFPYYYEHDLDDAVIYGKIEENKNSSIMLNFDKSRFEIGIDHEPAKRVSCYFAKKYKGTEKDFLMAKQELLSKIETL